METIKGREIADEIRMRVKEQVEASGFNPNLAIIVVGDDKQNLLYVGLKDKAVSFIGGTTHHINLPGKTTREELLEQIHQLNLDPDIDGILLQLPLPDALQAYSDEFLAAIDVNKDVDGFNPINRGRLIYGEPRFVSCAALGCLEVIHRSRGSVKGQKAVLVGDSFDQILPLALLLTREGCQVTMIDEMPSKNPLPVLKHLLHPAIQVFFLIELLTNKVPYCNTNNNKNSTPEAPGNKHDSRQEAQQHSNGLTPMFYQQVRYQLFPHNDAPLHGRRFVGISKIIYQYSHLRDRQSADGFQVLFHYGLNVL